MTEFVILTVGLEPTTHRMLQAFVDPLITTHYTAPMANQAFLFISAVCSVYFTNLLSSPLTLSSFSGPSMGVYGPNMTNGTLLGLTCNCFIDYTGMQTTFQNITTTPITSGNSTAFCHGDFADGNHTLTVIGSGTNEQPFWFDQLQYTPSPSLVPTNQTFSSSLIDSSAFTYSPDRDSTKSWPWINEPNTDLFGNEHTTAVNGAWFTVSFNGS